MDTNADVTKFGTFLGVYTPSVLTILGLIMYLRFGWVLGNVGLGLTAFIVLLAGSITVITALSASAISTNMRVGVGGEYYMISRSLGLELGGAIGIPLFLCRTLSITFYSFGLAEAIAMFVPGDVSARTIQLMTAIIIIAITFVSGKSASVVLKLQVPIMIAVGLSIAALIIGALSSDLRAPEMVATYRTAPQGFWYVFAVFFPAVTGFTAGIGMSGDLKDPRRSIPLGTMLAVATGMLIYLLVPVLLSVSSTISFEDLASKGVVTWSMIAILGAWLVVPGIFGAILSSAFGSVLGGPRVLQSLATDGLAPGFLSKLSKTGQPTAATWVSGGIALLAVALGGLNAVAQFVTIMFLTLYVMINFSAAIEKLTGDLSYRPKINIPWFVSLLGCLGAVIVMALINPIACVGAIMLEALLFIGLRRRAMKKEWGDVRAGFWGTLARFALQKLKAHEDDPRNWRPHILVFSGEVEKRMSLVYLASCFNRQRGILTICNLVIDSFSHNKLDIRAETEKMNACLEQEGILAFSEIDLVPDFENGAITVTQANGIAGLNSNTILFGWSDKRERMQAQIRIMRAVEIANKSTIIIRTDEFSRETPKKRIDLWWRGKHSNSDIMLLLAYMLTLNVDWKGAKIYLQTIILHENDMEFMMKSLTDMIDEIRISAEPRVIVKPPEKTVIELMHDYSQDADVVFLGLMIPAEGMESEYVDRMDELSRGFSTTVFVRNGSKFVGDLL
ncbi:MAG: amino acid permease [Candidatus Cloacimonetes bacterium]|nr:amino acid permease [Candidatus Cloacimonadota bacterium]